MSEMMIALDSFKKGGVCSKLRGDMWSNARFWTSGYHVRVQSNQTTD